MYAEPGRRRAGSDRAVSKWDSADTIWYEEGFWWHEVRSDWKGLGDYATVGLDLVLSILVGFFGGRWLDARLGAHGILTVLGFAFGTAAGFLSLYRAAVKMRKETEAADERDRQTRTEDKHGTDGR